METSKRINYVKFLSDFQRGYCKPSNIEKFTENVYMQDIKLFRKLFPVTNVEVTAMQWHPIKPDLFVTIQNSCILKLYKVRHHSLEELSSFTDDLEYCLIEFVRFNTKSSDLQVFTASLDGRVLSYDFNTSLRTVLFHKPGKRMVDFCFFSSLDVHQDGKSVYAGDSMGNLTICHLDDHKNIYGISGFKLHKYVITSVDFNPRDPNLFVTASADRKCKLWDIRMLNDKNSFVYCINDGSILSAKFSLTDGRRLLVTTINNKLSIYKAPSWTRSYKIHFSEYSSFSTKPCWHPKANICVINGITVPTSTVYGKRTTVDKCYRLMDSSILSGFNVTGDILATTTTEGTLNMWGKH